MLEPPPSRAWDVFERGYMRKARLEAHRILCGSTDRELAAFERRFPESKLVKAEKRRRARRRS